MDAGLENIIAAETVLSKVDGLNGRLIIRGYDVESLARHRSFEDVIHLLWSGFYEELPNTTVIQCQLGRARLTAFGKLQPFFPELAARPSMEGLRLALATCPDGDDLECALNVLATLAVATCGAARLRNGRSLIPPNPDLPHTDDVLFMSSGDAPAPGVSRALCAYFNTVSEHGLNASTFAARVVASTQAGLTSAAIAGLSALKGPLHGGAPGPVLDMFDAIGSVDGAEDWIEAALARGERLMGFGHRVYHVRDPRADALKNAVNGLPTAQGRLALAQAIETSVLKILRQAKPDRKLETNVEYYTAVLLEALDFNRADFTCIFASARAAGWLAHAKEQLSTRRIVRPKSVYVGPLPLGGAATAK